MYFDSPTMMQKLLILLGLVLARFGVFFAMWHLGIPRCPPLPGSFWGLVEWQLVETITVLAIGIPVTVLFWNLAISPSFGIKRIRFSHGMLLALLLTLCYAFFSL